jgi:glucokinase
MFLAIDIGGSKTLLAIFSPSGQVISKYKIDTNPNYEQFLADLGQVLREQFKNYDIHYCCCGVPGRLNREEGIGLAMGNLPWRNVPIKQDVAKLLNGAPVVIENDAKLAGLSEAYLVHEKYKKVLYLTIGTGIGDGIIIDGKIDRTLADSEPGQMAIEHQGEIQKWEDLASGQALVKRYGKEARAIDDPAIWNIYAKDLALGLDELVAVIQPEVVIIGGGVGAHFDKFGAALLGELKKLENDMVKIPPIMAAQRPEEAVIYGCYEFIKQQN